MALVERFHAYQSLSNTGQFWGCVEVGEVVAAFAWQPPPPGVAKALAPAMPAGVLALSRMVATPRDDRDWHLSKPLRWLMRRGIDRTRWPVLVTFADTSVGHSGHVYVCSGWQPDGESARPIYEDAEGRRVSTYSAGKHSRRGLRRVGTAVLRRFVHRICAAGAEREYMEAGGWRRVPTGRRWRNGKAAMTWVKERGCA